MQDPELPLVTMEQNTKIILLLIGGVGGIQSGPNMLTELQQSHRPHLNALTRKSISGLHQIAAPGMTPAEGVALQALLHSRENSPHSWKEHFSIKACAITENPRYQEICRACDFEVVDSAHGTFATMQAAGSRYPDYDFILVHVNETERMSRQGGYYEKIKAIEELDVLVPQLTALSPDVLAVTGDYSCPTTHGDITWHPVPLIVHAKTGRYDLVQSFDEIACAAGALGVIRTRDILPLLFAHANRLKSCTLKQVESWLI